MPAAGVPLEVIQRPLGHASIRTTADVYGSLPESIDLAVVLRQLDGEVVNYSTVVLITLVLLIALIFLLDDLFRPSCRADVVQGGDSTGSPWAVTL